MAGTFDKVLVPLDLSATGDRAIPVASALATGLDLPLELLTLGSPFGDLEAERRALDERLTMVNATVASASVAEASDVVAGIVRAAQQSRALVCMSTHGRGVLARTAVGSVARDVLQASHRPVLLVGPRMDVVGFDRPRSILLATDGSVTVRRDDAVSWLALRLRVPVHVVAVDEIAGVIVPGSTVSERSLVEHVEERCADLARLGVHATPHVVRGEHAAPEICTVASTLPSPLAVLAGHTSGIAGRLGLGSVSSTVVRAGPAPVLLVPRSRTGDDQAGTGGVGSA